MGLERTELTQVQRSGARWELGIGFEADAFKEVCVAWGRGVIGTHFPWGLEAFTTLLYGVVWFVLIILKKT